MSEVTKYELSAGVIMKKCNACGKCVCEARALKFEKLDCAGRLAENWREEDALPKLLNTQEATPVLPEWCKVGAWCYDYIDNDFAKVVAINPLELEYRNGDARGLDSDYRISEARVRPWTIDEIKPLLPLVVADRAARSNFHSVIFAASDRFVWLGASYGGIEYSALLAGFDKLDGSPCGVLEHLENGEWVK